MADVSKLKKLKRKSTLGEPPPLEEASQNLKAPETTTHTERIDARSMRRSGRTIQFATRVSPDFDRRIREIAIREELLLVEVLEKALDAYEKKLDIS